MVDGNYLKEREKFIKAIDDREEIIRLNYGMQLRNKEKIEKLKSRLEKEQSICKTHINEINRLSELYARIFNEHQIKLAHILALEKWIQEKICYENQKEIKICPSLPNFCNENAINNENKVNQERLCNEKLINYESKINELEENNKKGNERLIYYEKKIAELESSNKLYYERLYNEKLITYEIKINELEEKIKICNESFKELEAKNKFCYERLINYQKIVEELEQKNCNERFNYENKTNKGNQSNAEELNYRNKVNEFEEIEKNNFQEINSRDAQIKTLETDLNRKIMSLKNKIKDLFDKNKESLQVFKELDHKMSQEYKKIIGSLDYIQKKNLVLTNKNIEIKSCSQNHKGHKHIQQIINESIAEFRRLQEWFGATLENYDVFLKTAIEESSEFIEKNKNTEDSPNNAVYDGKDSYRVLNKAPEEIKTNPSGNNKADDRNGRDTVSKSYQIRSSSQQLAFRPKTAPNANTALANNKSPGTVKFSNEKRK